MKTTKLTLSSTNEELLYTMLHEGKSVEYWHKKHYGGKHKYDKWQDEQLEKVQTMPSGSEMIGEMVDYHSLTTGNRWKSFEVTSGYGVGNAYTRMFKFCYWDTYGSVGAFYNCVTADNKYNEILVFPSHFFLRYAERMGIHHRDAALVCEFFNRNHAFALVVSQDLDDDGRQQIIIGTKEGACYGFARTDVTSQEGLHHRDNVFEVRTFLKYEQLTKRQLEECQAVRDMAERGRLFDAPDINLIGRAMTDQNWYDDFLKHTARLLDIKYEQFKKLQFIMIGVLNTTDFVSGDLRGSHESFCNGELNSKPQRQGFRLMEILAKHIKENPRCFDIVTWHDILHVVHEWKGDNYDWNKWFWALCNKFKKEAKTEHDKSKFDPLMQKCIEGKFTYQSIDALMQSL